jgi:hypothetical protein
MRIRILTVAGRSFELEVDGEQTPEQLKTVIEEQTGMPVPTQLLLFNGTELGGDQALTEYGVAEDSIIHMTQSLRAG